MISIMLIHVFLEEEGLLQNMNNTHLMSRFEYISKKCNNLMKENAELHQECDRLTKEIQHLKRTTMRRFIEYFTFPIMLEKLYRYTF